MKPRVALIGLAIPLLIIGGFAAYTWSALNLSYSSGERSGYVQKLSASRRDC